MSFTQNSGLTNQNVTNSPSNRNKTEQDLTHMGGPANSQQGKGRGEGEIQDRGMDRKGEQIHTL